MFEKLKICEKHGHIPSLFLLVFFTYVFLLALGFSGKVPIDKAIEAALGLSMGFLGYLVYKCK